MSSNGPRRGDLVYYFSSRTGLPVPPVFFFQPNGSECYLYNSKSDIGIPEKAVYTPARGYVRKASPVEVAAFLKSKSQSDESSHPNLEVSKSSASCVSSSSSYCSIQCDPVEAIAEKLLGVRISYNVSDIETDSSDSSESHDNDESSFESSSDSSS